MSGYFTGAEYVRKIDLALEALQTCAKELGERRSTIASRIDEYSFPQYKMSELDAVVMNAMALARQVRGAL